MVFVIENLLKIPFQYVLIKIYISQRVTANLENSKELSLNFSFCMNPLQLWFGVGCV